VTPDVRSPSSKAKIEDNTLLATESRTGDSSEDDRGAGGGGGRVVEDMQALPDVLPAGSGGFGGVDPSLEQQTELCLMGLPGDQHLGASSPHLPPPASTTQQPWQAALSCLPLHACLAQ